MSSIKETIRQEIERRMEELERDKYINIDAKACRHSELKFLERFIDSLPEEKPSEDLEEAAEEYARLDEEGKWKDGGKYKAFIAGAEWQKKQMMKDAVEGEIGYWNQRGLSIRLDQSLEKLGYGEDTEVKIIIVKDDKGRND